MWTAELENNRGICHHFLLINAALHVMCFLRSGSVQFWRQGAKRKTAQIEAGSSGEKWSRESCQPGDGGIFTGPELCHYQSVKWLQTLSKAWLWFFFFILFYADMVMLGSIYCTAFPAGSRLLMPLIMIFNRQCMPWCLTGQLMSFLMAHQLCFVPDFVKQILLLPT